MKTFVLFGKKLLPDNTLSWVGEARCEKAIELLRKHLASQLIISGGRTTSKISEASAMRDYILKRIPTAAILLEEKSEISIHQLCILKLNFLLPRKVNEVGLITDEIHMPRLVLVATKIFGNSIRIIEYPADVRISGVDRKLIEEYEQKLIDLTKNNPAYVHGGVGDHELWLEYDEFYRSHRKKNPDESIEVNQAFEEYLKRKEHK